MQRSRHLHLPLFLLTLFLAYQVSITMFSHVHYINGVMLVHSHPSSDNHTHTEGQLLTLATVSSFVGIEPIAVELGDLYLSLLYTLDGKRNIRFVSALDAQCISLRAPPSFA